MNTYQDMIPAFLQEEKTRGRRFQGLRGLKNRVPKFLLFLETHSIDLFTLSVAEAQSYQGWLLETGTKTGKKYSTRTIASFMATAFAFCEYLKRNGKLLSNPFAEVRNQKVEKKLPRNVPKESEMDKLLKALERYHEKKDLRQKVRFYKAHVLAELLYSTGMRIAEAGNVKIGDIDFDRGRVFVREGKGGAERICFLNDYARDVLRLYVEKIRPLLKLPQHTKPELLFFAQWDRLGQVFNQVLKEVCAAEKLPHFTAHSFRHAFGYQLHRAGCKTRWIQELLGHEKLRNTEIYMKVDQKELQKEIDTFHPRKWHHEKTDTE